MASNATWHGRGLGLGRGGRRERAVEIPQRGLRSARHAHAAVGVEDIVFGRAGTPFTADQHSYSGQASFCGVPLVRQGFGHVDLDCVS
jgi:hypothetical protein